MNSKEKALLASLQQQIADSKAAQAAQQARYDAQFAAAAEPSEYEKLIGGQAKNVLNWAQQGDYSQIPKGIFGDFVDPAQRKRQRELTQNAGGQGISAFGGGNATLLGLNRQNLNDEFDRDQAINYQQNVSKAVSNAANVAGDLGSQETARKFNLLDSTTGQYNNSQNAASNASANLMNFQQQQANKPSGWSKLLGGLLGGASAFTQSASSLGYTPFASTPTNSNLVSTIKPNIGRSVQAMPLQPLPAWK